VKLSHAPLKDCGGYVWYDIANVELPENFDLVLCDGPAVFEAWGDAYPQWRYGLLPELTKRRISVKEILFDDATEKFAARLLDRWRSEFGMDHRMLRTKDGDYAVVRRTSGT